MDGLALAEPVAVTLVRRGYRTLAQAREFLDANESHDPLLLGPMAAVCERIRAAVAAGLRITVHGDYDVDGVSSTAITVRAVRELGGDCDWLIPGRHEDGYGLTMATVRRLTERGTGLLITADCGIGAIDEVAAAHAAGIEVIVTDHHQPGDDLPGCPILHPALGGYPFPELCATGVALQALLGALLGAGAAEARARPGRARHGRRPGPAARREPGPGATRARRSRAGAPARPAGSDGGRRGRARAPRRGRHRFPARPADQRRRAACTGPTPGSS